MMPTTFFKALADETRLKSLLLIRAENELCVCELMTALEQVQPKISRHLAQLKKAQILVDRRQGQWVFYHLNPDMPTWVKQLLEQTFSANQSLIKAPLARLQAMGERPQRAQACCSE
ncbi:metalloregulator ArsR/SmtB family transcription factor [Shewanella sp. Scap07]|uniref:metalloregulator ArsR/SmtB family transcription factor n=1 Tax=Shewanella sp. Scap07 TaxID=2589987 RepID=UPI0015BFB6FB|nr:metalloregulator ArsR/SmtB family transcription factor [Shewanella sp. Scap07]QLE87060.1 metalloregulator ArsR/SmtB family transcription factor [Shewanella sp. Scap07]